MRVKMTQCMAGPRIVRNVGDEVEVDAAEGKRLIAAGFAVPLAESNAEQATAEPTGETRVTESGKPAKPAKPKPKKKAAKKKAAKKKTSKPEDGGEEGDQSNDLSAVDPETEPPADDQE